MQLKLFNEDGFSKVILVEDSQLQDPTISKDVDGTEKDFLGAKYCDFISDKNETVTIRLVTENNFSKTVIFWKCNILDTKFVGPGSQLHFDKLIEIKKIVIKVEKTNEL